MNNKDKIEALLFRIEGLFVDLGFDAEEVEKYMEIVKKDII